jgi:glycosyltransferase involved in cell wall biosynthesis
MSSEPTSPAATTVQIGLPVYNGERFLASSLDALLAQTYPNVEVIISDNGSTDSTSEIAQRYAANDPRVSVVRVEDNRGAAWNFNRVVELSSAPYFKWATHDDLHDATYVARCVQVLEREPSVGLCYTASRYIDGEDRPVDGRFSDGCDLRQTRPSERLRGFFGTFPMHVLFGVVRREVLLGTRLWGGFASADRVLVSELAMQAQIAEIPEPLFIRRFHEDISWFPDMDEQEYAAWYDPKNAGKFGVPVLRRGREYVKGVRAAGLVPAEELRCHGEVLRYASWDHGVLRMRRYARRGAGTLRARVARAG